MPAAAIGGAAGLAAFVMTWLAGHPLLIFEVATAFWLVLGAVGASAIGDVAEPAGPERRSRLRAGEWTALVLAIPAIAPVPFRGH